MAALHRLIAVLGAALVLTAAPSLAAAPVVDGAPQPVVATVYVFRAMGGRLATPEMDNLADKIMARGLQAEVHSYVSWAGPARQAIARYNTEAYKSPIIVVGLSAGGDSAIRFAKRLGRVGVPVALVLTLDPTRIAGHVPANVARFINIYSSAHTFGGGDPQPAADFTGHFASVNLKNYPVGHRRLPTIAHLEERVVDKIVAVAEQPAVPAGPAARIAYPVPRDEPIVLWDSGLLVSAESGETAATIAARFGVPVWAVAAINDVDPDRLLSAGEQVIVPRQLESSVPSSR